MVKPMTKTGGTIQRWEVLDELEFGNESDPAKWTHINEVTNTITYTTTDASDKKFRLVVQVGNCQIAYSNIVTVTVNGLPTPGTPSPRV